MHTAHTVVVGPTWSAQDTYYIWPLYQAWEMKQLYLIHRRQRNMAQRKEQIKTPAKELSKPETSNLGAEFKTLVITMLNEL